MDETDLGYRQKIDTRMAMPLGRARHSFGQRRVDKDLERSQPLAFKQGHQIFQYNLRALDGKGRDQKISVTTHRFFDIFGQLLAAVTDQHGFACAVAIGCLTDDLVISTQLRIGAMNCRAGSDIAGK